MPADTPHHGKIINALLKAGHFSKVSPDKSTTGMQTMATTVTNPEPTAPTPAAPAPKPDIAKEILNDVIAAGLIAASIFVKNPTSQQHASTIINAVTPLIQLLESQI